MANVCELTGKRKRKGNRVSHANNKKIHFQQPNLQERHIFVPELGIRVGVKVSTAALRNIDKAGGLARYLAKANDQDLSSSMLRVKKQVLKRSV